MFKFLSRGKPILKQTKILYSTSQPKDVQRLQKTLLDLSSAITTFRTNEFPVESEEIKIIKLFTKKIENIVDETSSTNEEMGEDLNKELQRVIYDVLKIFQQCTFPSLKDNFLKMNIKELHQKNIIVLDTIIFNEILNCFVMIHDKINFNLAIVDMKEFDIEINVDTFKAMIKICVHYKEYEKVSKIVDMMKKMEFEIDDEISDILLHDSNPIMKMNKEF